VDVHSPTPFLFARPSEFFSEISVRIFAEKGSDFIQETQHIKNSYAKDEKINLRANTIKAIIEKLEKYNLSGTSTDIKGIAFEKFLGKT